jgi:hypothetical protein
MNRADIMGNSQSPETGDTEGHREHLTQHLSKWKIYRFQLPHIRHQLASAPASGNPTLPSAFHSECYRKSPCDSWVTRTSTEYNAVDPHQRGTWANLYFILREMSLFQVLILKQEESVFGFL